MLLTLIAQHLDLILAGVGSIMVLYAGMVQRWAKAAACAAREAKELHVIAITFVAFGALLFALGLAI